jgi:hypothetical protein
MQDSNETTRPGNTSLSDDVLVNMLSKYQILTATKHKVDAA